MIHPLQKRTSYVSKCISAALSLSKTYTQRLIQKKSVAIDRNAMVYEIAYYLIRNRTSFDSAKMYTIL